MIDEPLQEMAALHALGLLDEAGQAALRAAAERDPEVRALMDQMAETAAALACDAPQVAPPPAVLRELKRQLPPRRLFSSARVVAFPEWMPYALAAGLAVLAVAQVFLISGLKKKVVAAQAETAMWRDHDNMVQMRLASLQAQDAAYANAKVMVAWDPKMHHGYIAMENMPPPPPGHDYQLWVLDPGAPAPISAGLLRMGPDGQGFVAAQPMETPGPGFAISLEPSGGRSEPTPGAILFAVAPGG
jgi:anti-sigma-K factor RskA